MNRRVILCMLVGIVVAAATVPLASSADRDHQLVIGVRLNFNNSPADGTFAACCAVNDSGTAQAEVKPINVKDDILSFGAVETFVGSKGTFRLALRGTTGPLSNPRHIAQGSWRVLDGTGAYAGLGGEGTFTGLTDENEALTAINTGDVDG